MKKKKPRGGGGDPKQKKAEEGRGTERNATLLEQNATLTKLRVQRKHNVGTCHGDIPLESAPTLTNNGKHYKR